MARQIEGVDELRRRIAKMTIAARVRVLGAAVDEGAKSAADEMSRRAPRNDEGPTRPSRGHGADNIVTARSTDRKKKDRRALVVGPTDSWMFFQEFGTPHHSPQPFVRPTIKAMKSRMLKITEKHMKRALR